MKVSEIMTRDAITVDKDERLETVLESMRKHRISKLPVVEKGKLVGIISDGEIADELGAIKNKGVATNQLHASSAMRRDAQTVHPDQDVEDAIDIAKRGEGAGIIPVVHDNHVVGVVTGADLIKLVKDATHVKEFMITELHSVEPTDRVIHARRIMLDNDVERLPVLNGGELVGILGESDLAFGFAKFRKRFADNVQAERLKSWYVEDVMNPKVVTGRPDMTAEEAASLMLSEDVGSLPVLNSGTKIAGMITRSDLIKRLDS